MIEVRDLDEASYITAKTNVVASVGRKSNGFKVFLFDDTQEVIKVRNRYKSEVDKASGDLPVDLTRFLACIRYYNKELNNI